MFGLSCIAAQCFSCWLVVLSGFKETIFFVGLLIVQCCITQEEEDWPRAATNCSISLKKYIEYSNFKTVALAASDIGTSGGKVSVSCHNIIFLYVSVGDSEQKGG